MKDKKDKKNTLSRDKNLKIQMKKVTSSDKILKTTKRNPRRN